MTAYNSTTSAINTEYVDEVKSRLTMHDIICTYLHTTAKHNKILCPFHDEKTPSFHIFDDGYKCYGGCGGGDIIKFVEIYFNLDFNAAMSKINNDFNLGLPIGEKPTLRQEMESKKRQIERDKKREAKETNIAKLMCKFRATCKELKRLRQNYNLFKPSAVCSELHPLFAEAIQNIDYYDYLASDLSEQISHLEHP